MIRDDNTLGTIKEAALKSKKTPESALVGSGNFVSSTVSSSGGAAASIMGAIGGEVGGRSRRNLEQGGSRQDTTGHYRTGWFGTGYFRTGYFNAVY